MFISIAIVDLKLLVMTSVVKPVVTMLVQPVCYVSAVPGLVDIIFAEKLANKLQLNGPHSSLKPDLVILPIERVNFSDVDI